MQGDAVVLGMRSGRVALAAAALSLGVFMLLSEVHERYMFPALAFLLMASVQSKRMWLAYGVLSATFLFNLVTVSPFTSLLGTNLVATEPATFEDRVLKVLALLCAAVNLGALVWLTSMLGTRPQAGSRGTIIAPAPAR